MAKRVIIIVLDSAGCGAMPDSKEYGDPGVNTLGHIIEHEKNIKLPNLARLGLYKILGFENPAYKGDEGFDASFGMMSEASKGKDTVIGHWEIAGLVTKSPMPTYPDGFPLDLIASFEKETGRKSLGNFASSGTEILIKLGDEHVKTGFPIIYTSADSVFQIAAHEEVIPLNELYKICETARRLLTGEHGVGRVIARPFTGKSGEYKRTTNRKDFALKPQKVTLLNVVQNSGGKVTGVGKISDIFVGSGVSESFHIDSNKDGILKTLDLIKMNSGEGTNSKHLIFTNLVDFDMVYGHRRDIAGYGKALEEFDSYIPELEAALSPDDILFITADHGCDPAYPAHTDHTREYVPLVITGKKVKKNNFLGTLESFADLGKTAADYFGIENSLDGESFLSRIFPL